MNRMTASLQPTLRRPSVLVVEDDAADLDLLRETLERDVEVITALNAEEATSRLRGSALPDLILLDIGLPGTDGYSFCRALKASPDTRDIPVIFVTALDSAVEQVKGFEAGAVDYITKPLSPAIVSIRVRHQLELYDKKSTLRRRIDWTRQQLRASELKLIACLGRASQFNQHTLVPAGNHVQRLRMYVRLLARRAGLPPGQAERMGWAATLHDVGMIGVPDTIVNRKKSLSDEERAKLRSHVWIGVQLVGKSGGRYLEMAREIIWTHHERWDGKGFPAGLHRSDIPVSGRIVAIADVFDALTSSRPWRSAWLVDSALVFIRDQAGTRFDPELADLFIEARDDLLAIMDRYPDGHPDVHQESQPE